MKILIITGGTSSERKISLMSAKQVQLALSESGFQVRMFDLKKGYSELKKTAKDYDILFPVIHGEEGEGGSLQQFLCKLNKPFVGGDPKGFKTGWYKISFKKFCNQNHIITSRWKAVKTKPEIINFGFPCVLKSSNGGSSKEVVILKKKSDLHTYRCRKLFNSTHKLFVEKFLPGVEVTVGILQNKALPVVEIVPPKNGWFDYQNKYWGQTKELTNSPSLDPKMRSTVQKIALGIHQKLRLGSFSRIDFIISDNKPFVLEVNTIPGLTPYSAFPKAAQAIGLNFSKLLKTILLSNI